jgi:hypothetical protein
VLPAPVRVLGLRQPKPARVLPPSAPVRVLGPRQLKPARVLPPPAPVRVQVRVLGPPPPLRSPAEPPLLPAPHPVRTGLLSGKVRPANRSERVRSGKWRSTGERAQLDCSATTRARTERRTAIRRVSKPRSAPNLNDLPLRAVAALLNSLAGCRQWKRARQIGRNLANERIRTSSPSGNESSRDQYR